MVQHHHRIVLIDKCAIVTSVRRLQLAPDAAKALSFRSKDSSLQNNFFIEVCVNHVIWNTATIPNISLANADRYDFSFSVPTLFVDSRLH